MIQYHANWRKRIYCCLGLFLIVFNPPLIRRLSFTTLFSVISAAYLVFHYAETRRMLRKLKRPLAWLLASFLYYLVICVLNIYLNPANTRTILVGYVNSIVHFVSQMSVSLFVIQIARKYRLEKNSFIFMFIIVGVLQGLLGVMCFVLPPVKRLLNALMVRNISSPEFALVVSLNSFRRNYGFASTLFDIFGFTMSLLSVLSFNKAFTSKDKKYYIGFAIITVAAVLNARTSIVLIAVGVIITLFLARERNRKPIDSVKRVLFYLLLILIVFLAYRHIQTATSATALWLKEGIDQILNLLQGMATGIFETMGEEFIFFPENPLSTIFGTALTPMEIDGRSTDMGYILCIWKYGIVGSLINYGFWISLLRSAYKKRTGRFDQILVVSIGVILFVYQIKLSSWGYSMAGSVYYPLLFYLILEDQRELEKIKQVCSDLGLAILR